MSRLSPLIATFALAILTASGCGGRPSGQPLTPDLAQQQKLLEIGEAYRVFIVGNDRPPKDLDELSAMEMQAPLGLQALRDDEVVVYWDVTLPDLSEEPGIAESEEVLAYESQVPESGGLVLLADRTVEQMTPEQFASAPKGGAESSADAGAAAKPSN